MSGSEIEERRLITNRCYLEPHLLLRKPAAIKNDLAKPADRLMPVFSLAFSHAVPPRTCCAFRSSVDFLCRPVAPAWPSAHRRRSGCSFLFTKHSSRLHRSETPAEQILVTVQCLSRAAWTPFIYTPVHICVCLGFAHVSVDPRRVPWCHERGIYSLQL